MGKEERERDSTIDILRGIGIVIMVMGHLGLVIGGTSFSIWYHSFHMPLFYVISGFFIGKSLRKRHEEIDCYVFIQKKAKSLLLPYFIWGIIYIVYANIANGSMASFRENIAIRLLNPTKHVMPVAGALWFLPALFWMNVIYLYFYRLLKNRYAVWIMSIVLGVTGMLLTTYGVFLPFCLDAALVGVFFMAVGDALSCLESSERKFSPLHMKWYLFIPMFVITNVLVFVNGSVNFREGSFKFIPLTLFNAVAGIVLLWNFSDFLNRIKGKNSVFNGLIGMLETIGCDTLVYLCTNQFFISLVMPVFQEIGANSEAIETIERVVILFIVLFLCNVMGKVLGGFEKTKFLVGKK